MWSHLHGSLKMFSHKRHQGMSAMLCSGNRSLQTQSISLASSSAVWTADTLMFLALSSASLSFCSCSLLGLPQPHQCRLLCRRQSDRLRRPPRESQPGPADGSDFVRCHAVCGGGIHHPGPASREPRHSRLSFNTWDVSVWLCFYWSWQCRDAGGSMVIHAFGGYYGLGISWVLYRPNLHQSKRLNGSMYHSDVFAMIGAYLAHSLSSCQHFMLFFFFRPTGTLFLWMFWPSFNSAITDHGDGQHRAAINTYLGLASCVLTTVALSSMHDKRGRLDMVTLSDEGRITAGWYFS